MDFEVRLTVVEFLEQKLQLEDQILQVLPLVQTSNDTKLPLVDDEK